MKDITKNEELQTQIPRCLDNLLFGEMVTVNRHPRKALINRMQSGVYTAVYALVVAFLNKRYI